MQQLIALILSREVKWMASKCLTIVSAEANMIEAVLKTMFEFVNEYEWKWMNIWPAKKQQPDENEFKLN